ncbi:MAG: hypothetical protein HC900_00985 [Methylacidiphilales bacterium]|nr:hypothetical protein [Candidatus Methylacidiphilales bacterium]
MTAATKPATPHPATDLSFMRLRQPLGSGIDYWNVDFTGSLDEEWQHGRTLAYEYLRYIGEHHNNANMTLLGLIVNDMLTKCAPSGRLGGVELGFLNFVNIFAATAAMKVKLPGPEDDNAD